MLALPSLCHFQAAENFSKYKKEEGIAGKPKEADDPRYDRKHMRFLR